MDKGIVYFTDDQIAAMLRVPKGLAADSEIQLRPKAHKNGVVQLQGAIDVPGDDERTYRILVRCGRHKSDNFSVILCVLGSPTHDGEFRLRRYNGNNHEHTNELERDTISFQYHMHTATERYQMHVPEKPDGYAVQRSGFTDYWEALKIMFEECGFVQPPGAQLTLREVDEP